MSQVPEVGGGLLLGLVPESGVDEEELAQLALDLRARLLELDVDDVRFVRTGPAPDGTKTAGGIAAGALLVSAAPFVWRGVLDLVRSWLENRPVRSVKVELEGRSIELADATPEQQRLLVEAFLRGGPEPERTQGQPSER